MLSSPPLLAQDVPPDVPHSDVNASDRDKSATPLGASAEGKSAVIAAYMARHAEDKKKKFDYCYRHHPDHRDLLPDKGAMKELQSELQTLDTKDCEAISHMWSLFNVADSRQRRILLRGMLSQCCFPQLSDISAMIKDLVRIDFISALPIELSFRILEYLDAKSLCRASMVSKRWQELCDDDVVWYHLCEQHIDRKCTTCGWGLPLLDRRRLRGSKQAISRRLETLSNNQRIETPYSGPLHNDRIVELASTSGKRRNSASTSDYDDCSNSLKRIRQEATPDSASPSPRASSFSEGSRSRRASGTVMDSALARRTRPWKDVYIERYKIESNWRTGTHITKDFQHASPVLSLQFDEQYLITGTYDGHVNVWDLESGELIRVLKGHFRGVSALKFDGTKLVTGSWDQSVRVWNYRLGQCVCTCAGHDSKVLCIDFEGDLIAAGSADATIKVWDFAKKSCFTLRGHTEPVSSVKFHKDSHSLYTSSEDLTMRMWCLKSRECIRVFGGPENGPMAHIAQIQQALPITLEHLEGEQEDHHHVLQSAAQENANSTSVARSKNEDDIIAHGPTHLLTASLDNTIKLWDIKTGRCARTLFGHVEGVWCIAADNFRIVSGAHDKLVKVWDVQSGKCWHTFSGHSTPVCCVGLNDTGFASGGDDGLVKYYSFDIQH